MKDKFRQGLLAGGLLIVGPMFAFADSPPGPPDGFGFADGARPPPFMRGVALNEVQQDKVFSIMHAAAPALRDREKAVHKAREALHQLVSSPSFSESSAASLAQAQGSAESQLALVRTKLEHDVYAVLTPEQQSRIATHEKECDSHGHGGGMPPGGPGGPDPGPR